MLEAAEHHALAVLAGAIGGAQDDVLFAMAHQTLASAAVARGDLAGSEARLDQAYARQSRLHARVAGASFTTLVLVSRRAGNIPFKTLLPPLRSDLIPGTWSTRGRGSWRACCRHAVVLNAIGDADVAMASRDVVEAVLAACGKPVMNRPERVHESFPPTPAETFAGIEGLVVPADGAAGARAEIAGRRPRRGGGAGS